MCGYVCFVLLCRVFLLLLLFVFFGGFFTRLHLLFCSCIHANLPLLIGRFSVIFVCTVIVCITDTFLILFFID